MEKIIIKTDNIQIKECDYLLEIALQYQNTDVGIIKTNLQKILNHKYKNCASQTELAKLLKIDISTLQSYLYIAHTTQVPLDKLIWICGKLNVSLSTVFQPVTVKTVHNRIWTIDKKQELIDCYNIKGIDATMQEYNLTRKSVMHYYNIFNRELY